MRALLLSALLLAAAPARGEAPAPRVSGSAETVFRWESERCARWDIPDAPARAWRDGTGGVRLIAGSEETRAERGPSLDALARDCAVLHRGGHADDPGAYDDRSWIASVFTLDGRRVEALAHVEHHGHLRPEQCVGDYGQCWRNAIVALVSTDGGRTFARDGLVAALPYVYDGAQDGRTGYFNPSNVVRRGDHLYVFVFAEAHGAQRRGACLLRRPVTGGAADWRAWDGRGFDARFADPYRERVADPRAHVCAPLAGLDGTISSVVRRDGLYLAVTPAARRDAAGVLRSGIHWTVSEDLISWSPPALLWEAPLLWRRDCAAPAVFAYPSLIDGDAVSRSFEDVDETFWLYVTEAPLDDACRVGPRRNLLRLPVSWPRGSGRRRGGAGARRSPVRPGRGRGRA